MKQNEGKGTRRREGVSKERGKKGELGNGYKSKERELEDGREESKKCMED